MKKTSHLESFLTKKQIATVIKKDLLIKESSNEYYALQYIVAGNTARTGASGYSKGWAKKSIWTHSVHALCLNLGISVEVGNDASRGGASGEYVKPTNLKQLSGNKVILNRIAKAKKEAADKYESERKVIQQAIYNEADSIIIDDEFKSKIQLLKNYSGQEKSNMSASIFKALLHRNNITEIKTDFWQVFRILKNKAK